MIDLRSIKLQSINLGGVDLSGIRLGYHKGGQAGEPVPDVENAIMLVDGGPILLEDGQPLLLSI